MEQRYPDTPIRVEHELIEAMKLILRHSSWLKDGIAVRVAKGTTAQRLLALQDTESGCRICAIHYKIHQGLPDVRRMVRSMHSNFKLLVHAPKRDTDELLQRPIFFTPSKAHLAYPMT